MTECGHVRARERGNPPPFRPDEKLICWVEGPPMRGLRCLLGWHRFRTFPDSPRTCRCTRPGCHATRNYRVVTFEDLQTGRDFGRPETDPSDPLPPPLDIPGSYIGDAPTLLCLIKGHKWRTFQDDPKARQCMRGGCRWTEYFDVEPEPEPEPAPYPTIPIPPPCTDFTVPPYEPLPSELKEIPKLPQDPLRNAVARRQPMAANPCGDCVDITSFAHGTEYACTGRCEKKESRPLKKGLYAATKTPAPKPPPPSAPPVEASPTPGLFVLVHRMDGSSVSLPLAPGNAVHSRWDAVIEWIATGEVSVETGVPSLIPPSEPVGGRWIAWVYVPAGATIITASNVHTKLLERRREEKR